MKRIVYPAVLAIALTIVLAWFHEFTGYFPVKEVGKYWVLFSISWTVGILASTVTFVLLGKILHLDARKWTGQDVRAAVFGVIASSLFLGFEFHTLAARSLSRTLFSDPMTSVRMHVADTFGVLLGWCILGGLLYLLYRIAQRTRYRRARFEGGRQDRKQMVFLILKLLGIGGAIVIFTVWIAGTEFSKRIHASYLDRNWNSTSDSLICGVTFNNTGVSHRKYLETLVQICGKLSDAGAGVVVVPLPTDLSYSPIHAKLVDEIARYGNVVFAVPADEKSQDPQFDVDPPLENKVKIEWGVISAMPFSSWWWRPYKYYPFSYRVGPAGPKVPDVAVVAVRKFLGGKENMQPMIVGRTFSVGQYSTGLLDDQGAIIQHRVYPFFPYEFYASVNDNADSVEYAIRAPQMPIQSNPPEELWRLMKGKIVIIEPGDQITRSGNFAWTYGNIIHNILKGESTRPLDGWTPLITATMLVLVACLIVFVRPWLGLVLVVGLAIGQGYFYSWLALNHEIGIEPFPPIVGTLVGLFAFSFVLIADERKQMDRQEKKRIGEELKAAHDMQMGLMPTEDPKIVGFDISGKCIPADEVGGDFFDYVWLDEKKTRLGIAIGDVSGKAMKAAITAVLTSGMVYREAGTGETPRTILRKMNKPMYLKTDRRMFTAMTFAVIDIRKKILTFSNAGQMQPILKRGGKVQSLKVDGVRFPLGMMEQADYEEVAIRLRPNDMILFYTDGVVEAMNEKKELFGFDRIESIVKAASSNQSAKQIVSIIMQQAHQFTGGTIQHDDMTVVVVRVL
jgi:serine phosphatase RsbU (regulator of sigma subunit)